MTFPISESKKVPTDEFRSVADVSLPDWRQKLLICFNHQDGSEHPKTFDDQHRSASGYPLADSVAEEIRIQWDTARNLWLYAWHVWRFYPVAERHAFSTLELALRTKVGKGQQVKGLSGLQKLMLKAIESGLLHDEAIGHYRSLRHIQKERFIEEQQRSQELGWPAPEPLPAGSSQDYCKMLAEIFPKLRNHYAHGSSSVGWSIELTFSLCRDLINQLYE